MTARIFAILAAIFLVAAVGIAALTPLGLTLGIGIVSYDKAILSWLQEHSGPWLWTWLELPLLQRPLWLLPASLGVICAGLATSFNFGKTTPQRRRRS
jgi:hypothetical protein